MVVPQFAYECGNARKNSDQEPTILFFSRGCLGVKLSNAVNGDFMKRMEDRDELSSDESGRGLTIRMHVGS